MTNLFILLFLHCKLSKSDLIMFNSLQFDYSTYYYKVNNLQYNSCMWSHPSHIISSYLYFLHKYYFLLRDDIHPRIYYKFIISNQYNYLLYYSKFSHIMYSYPSIPRNRINLYRICLMVKINKYKYNKFNLYTFFNNFILDQCNIQHLTYSPQLIESLSSIKYIKKSFNFNMFCN